MSKPISYNRYYVGRLVVQPVGELLVEGNEVSDVDVAVVLFRQHVFAYLVSTLPSASCIRSMHLRSSRTGR